jgi:molybdopterin-synthase adenylyltransferase
VVKRAAQTDQAIVLVHTHPGSRRIVGYSPVDDAGERELFQAFYGRAITQPHASMVMSEDLAAGRFWFHDGGNRPADRLLVVGARLDIVPLNGLPLPAAGGGELHDRQVIAFGTAGQARLSTLTVAVVGLGGTGSVTTQQLVRLGVRRLILVDHDYLEESNVSRVYGSTLADARQGLSKVEIALREAKAVGLEAEIETIQGSVLDEEVALQLRRADVIFGCTDNHWSRAILNSLAYQYYLPLIDMGNRIDSDGLNIRAMSGRVSLVQPGAPCLFCSGIIDPKQISAESLSNAELESLAREGYVTGLAVANPSVISLNTTVAGLAVGEFLNLVTGFGGTGEVDKPRPQLHYDAAAGTVRPVQYEAAPTCLCGKSAYVGIGDGRMLPCRSRPIETSLVA